MKLNKYKIPSELIYHAIVSNVGVDNIFSPKYNRVGRGTKKFLRALLDTTSEVMEHRKTRKTRRRYEEKSKNLGEMVKEK